jgi:hypothetical protein
MNVVLSYGLGVDSTALLLRWLHEPATGDFDLSDLLVVTSMTGDEWPRTAALVQEHILPRLRAAGVRYAQVARGGSLQADGIRVLDDTTSPTRLYAAGAYRLSDELRTAGTIPQTGGNRICSMKFKGWVIDEYLRLYAPAATRHAFGFELGEQRRADDCERHMNGRLALGFEVSERGRARRATAYDTPYRVAEFPLIEWGWARERCERYIEQHTGVPDWPKSACDYCPFALTSRAGRERTLLRYDTRPESLMKALMLERAAVCLNPRGGLIAGERLATLVAERRPHMALAFEERLTWTPHAVFEVQRLWKPRREDATRVANASRALRILMEGSRRRCESYVRTLGQIDRADGIERVYRLRRGTSLPAREHYIVAAPAGAVEKSRRRFATWWTELEHQQLDLLAAAA